MRFQGFELHIRTENAAFEDDKREEIARILREVAADVLKLDREDGNVRDANGNTVGGWYLGEVVT
jgi:hypothetical protein